MAAAKKPTAQQKAQAKARAGGNDAIKVTKAGVKRLGKAALIAGSLTPAGRGVKAASMAVKAVKAAKSAKAVKSSRQAGDFPVSGSSAKKVMRKITADAKYVAGRDSAISENVKIKNTVSPSGRESMRGGASQVFNQTVRNMLPVSKAEAKANARGLKAANKPKGKKMSSKDIKKFEKFIDAEVKKIK